MKRFEVGKLYNSGYDSGVPAVKILKRTAKMCLVQNDVGNQWRMKIKEYNDHEEMTDTCVPMKWRLCYTYSSDCEEV